ncbi:MAG: T9SS type A sorting domain-containing protein [candidate division Zixibacteria bacterium]|nr:T9SS type A sorting domain-containing protein [candidate division Zixibacteria bacterium]
MYAFDETGDSSVLVGYDITPGNYDAHPKPPDMCDKSFPIPKEFSLSHNYPNPFNSITNIGYMLPADTYVKLTIYNIVGQKVRTLIDGEETAGYKNVIWDGKNDNGEEVCSGIYFYLINAGSFAKASKMSLLK